MASLGKEESLIKRKLGARIFHAVFFEVTAVILTSLFLVLVMKKDIWSMGVLSIIISFIATVWNGIFNFIFDRLQKRFEFSRTRNVRVLHALCFEGGLFILTIPLVMLYLGVGPGEAFLLEAALIFFFLPYSIIFNYIYDRIYIWLVERKVVGKSE